MIISHKWHREHKPKAPVVGITLTGVGGSVGEGVGGGLGALVGAGVGDCKDSQLSYITLQNQSAPSQMTIKPSANSYLQVLVKVWVED